ncbi:MAG: hypothetical protein NC210_01790 [[Clostridium] fimetarium]|nr:hypothetical protein [Alistipes timonensis]MCM1405135.1 hypothetical protein [[Clostridium] fimetarium]
MKHPIDFIKQFATLSPEGEERLRSAMRERSFARGERITGAATLSSRAFFILTGAARVCFIHGGKDHTISFAFDEEFVHLSHIGLTKEPETIAIEFLEPTRLLYIPTSVKDILKEEATIAEKEALLFLNVALAMHVFQLEERIYIGRTCKAPELYNWAITRFPKLTKVANLSQIASFLGLTRETVYRIHSGNYKK